MSRLWERYGLAAAVSLMAHGAFGITLDRFDDDSVLLFAAVVPEVQVELVDIEVPPPPEPAPEPEPEEAPPPEPAPVAEPPRARAEPPQQRVETTPAPPSDAPPPPATEEPAPGWADDDAPGAALDLGEVGPSATATVPVAQGKGTKPGRMGTGSGKGGAGGDGNGGAPTPVSIASIKKLAQPIGNKDLIQAKDYPEEAKRLGIEGVVKIKLIVDATGKVTRRSLIEKLGHGFDQLAMRYAEQLRFEPAIDTNDQPVASVVVWTFRFVLPE